MEAEGLKYKTLRDELAMAALPLIFQDSKAGTKFPAMAKLAYEMADFMLKARE